MNYFGKHLYRYRNIYTPELHDAANMYKKSIVDDETLVLASDGSSYVISDIALLKGLNSSSSQALSEALSMRMHIRESTGRQDLKDSDIKASMRPRYTQDKTEVEAFSTIVKYDMADEIRNGDIDYEDTPDGRTVESSSNNTLTGSE